jgi:copper chaperone NosL
MAARRTFLAAFFLFSVIVPFAAQAETIEVKKSDKCPVCGMFVAKYPDFIAKITFNDASYSVFDGTKDMFKYYFDLKRYNPKRELSEITEITVTDYYEMSPIDGRTAVYVTGSDVYGPMGHELIPFSRQEDAEVFFKDHGGKRILQFDEVTPALVGELD